MKKSDFDFSVPNRQSYVAILTIMAKTINVVFRQLIPILVVIMIGGSKNKSDYALYFIIAISSITMLYAIINFFKTHFIIENGELVLHTGVIKRKKMSIPFEKIQTINFEQNIIHRFFSVVKLKVDTAGSDKNEFEFQAIEIEKAQALRDLVLAEKADRTPTLEAETIINSEPIFNTIMSLKPLDLIKVGLTENHLRSIGLIMLFFFWIYENLKDVGVEVDEYSEELPDLDFGNTIFILMGVLLLFVAIFLSLVRTVVKYYDLQFLRSSRGFKVISGLLTKREVSAIDHKIQFIAWSDNLLQRWIGFKNLTLNQASSKQITTKQNISIPGCKMHHISNVIHTLFGEVDLDRLEMLPVDRKYFIRFAVLLSVGFGILIALFCWLTLWTQFTIAVCLLAYMLLNRYLAYRKKAFGHNEELLYIKGGKFGDKAEILPIFKIQALEIHQSPYQTRHALCSITIYTAAGRVQIPYISHVLALRLLDIFLQKVETDTRQWM